MTSLNLDFSVLDRPVRKEANELTSTCVRCFLRASCFLSFARALSLCLSSFKGDLNGEISRLCVVWMMRVDDDDDDDSRGGGSFRRRRVFLSDANDERPTIGALTTIRNPLSLSRCKTRHLLKTVWKTTFCAASIRTINTSLYLKSKTSLASKKTSSSTSNRSTARRRWVSYSNTESSSPSILEPRKGRTSVPKL